MKRSPNTYHCVVQNHWDTTRLVRLFRFAANAEAYAREANTLYKRKAWRKLRAMDPGFDEGHYEVHPVVKEPHK